jgi:hypothetical protein
MRIARLSLVLTLLLPASAWACSCVPPGSPEEEAARADHVFVGNVVAMRPIETLSWWKRFLIRVGLAEPEPEGPPEYTVVLREVEAFKGARAGEFTVRTTDSGGLCGYPFKAGERYVVYGQEHRGAPYAGICSLTGPAADSRSGLPWLRANRGRIP